MRGPNSTFATRLGPALLLAVVAGWAVVAASPHAGSWNDGSRLASVEALGHHGTFVIDESIFVQVPAELATGPHPPYPATDSGLLTHGTRDKLFINGHFYSDKTPLASVAMAGTYRLARMGGLPPAAERPDLFCRLLTILTSGVATYVAVWCLLRTAIVLGLSSPLALLLAASLALATVVPAYSRYVNNHIMLLGVTSAAVLQLVQIARAAEAGRTAWLRLAAVGTLAGIGYNLDLGAGPVLAVCLVATAIYRCRSLTAGLVVALTSAPWIAAGLGFNYAIGGVWKPMNAVPAYLQWPGSPFTTDNLTGLLRHTPGEFVLYSLGLLFGKHGFLGHNLPLWLLLPAGAVLWRARRDRPELAFALVFSGGTWLMYALFSNNAGGACLSIRWFVPLLAPAFLALAITLRDQPSFRGPFLALLAGGLGLGGVMAVLGPWHPRMVPGFWVAQAVSLLTAGLVWRRTARQAAAVLPINDRSNPTQRAA